MMEKIKEMSKLEKVLCVVVCVLVVLYVLARYKISKPEEQTTESQYNTETDVEQERDDYKDNYVEQEQPEVDSYDKISEVDAVVKSILIEAYEGHDISLSHPNDSSVSIDIVSPELNVYGVSQDIVDQMVREYNVDTTTDNLSNEIEKCYLEGTDRYIDCTITIYDVNGLIVYVSK